MLSETPVTLTICVGPLLVSTRPTTSAGNRLCIWRASLSSLIFQSSFMSLALAVVRIFSSCCQAVRCTLPPSVNQSAGLLLWANRPGFQTTMHPNHKIKGNPRYFTDLRYPTCVDSLLFCSLYI